MLQISTDENARALVSLVKNGMELRIPKDRQHNEQK
jgi:hypothetical protein